LPWCIVDDGTHLIRPDYDDLLVHSAFYHLCAHRQGVEEAAAGGVEVEAEGVNHPRFIGGDVCGIGEDGVSGYGGTDDEVDVFRVGACFFQQALQGFYHHDRCTLVFAFEDVPGFDSRTGGNPLIVGIDDGGELFVRQYVVWHVAVNTGNGSANFRHRLGGGSVRAGKIARIRLSEQSVFGSKTDG